MPTLETLEVDVTTGVRVFSGLLLNDVTRRFTIPATAPCLHTIRFFPPQPSGIEWSDLTLPWSQLTHIYGGRITMKEIFPLFSRCVHLQHCAVMLAEVAFKRPSTPIVVPDLITLELHLVLEHFGLTNLLDNLVFRRLLTLEVHFDSPYPPRASSSEQLIYVLSKASCTLEKFIAPQLVICGNVLLDLIRRTPTLIEVVVQYSDPGSASTKRAIALLSARRLERFQGSPSEDLNSGGTV